MQTRITPNKDTFHTVQNINDYVIKQDITEKRFENFADLMNTLD